VLAPSGRVLRRTVSPLNLAATEDIEYGYAGPGDSPAYHRPTLTGTPITTYVTGPAGLLLTDTVGITTWPLANAHGDIIGTTNPLGTYTANPTTDEFGVGTQAPDRLGWLGAHQRYTTGGTLNLTRMGVRLYDPALGRFHQVDPIEGGCSNDYVYVRDPVNEFDLAGTKCPGWFHNAAKFVGYGDGIRAVHYLRDRNYSRASKAFFGQSVSFTTGQTGELSWRIAARELRKGAAKKLAQRAAGAFAAVGAPWVGAGATYIDGICVLLGNKRPPVYTDLPPRRTVS